MTATASTSRTSHYEASVTFRFRNVAGELETKTIAQDVTDEIAEGADEEELVDRIYWNQVHGQYLAVDIIGGSVKAST